MIRLLLALLLTAGGCSTSIELLPQLDGGNGPGDLQSSDGPGLLCPGGGDPIKLDVSGSATCASAVAQQLHAFALCSCDELKLSSRLDSMSFSSTGGTPQRSAAIGTNRTLTSEAELEVEGSVWVAEALAVHLGGAIARTLRSGGSLLADEGELSVGGDAFINGDVSGDGPISIDGTLHVPASATIAASVSAQATQREPVAIPTPCACNAATQIDLAGLISAAATTNDNAAIGLSVDALRGDGALTTLALPCGRFYVSAIETQGTLTLDVSGRAALLVRDDVVLRGALEVTLASGAELDLVIGGTMTSFGRHDIGSTASPSRMRLWIASSKTVLLDGAPALRAITTASRSLVSAPSGLEVFGSLLTNQLVSAGPTTLHFDEAVLTSGQACGAPATPIVD